MILFFSRFLSRCFDRDAIVCSLTSGCSFLVCLLTFHQRNGLRLSSAALKGERGSKQCCQSNAHSKAVSKQQTAGYPTKLSYKQRNDTILKRTPVTVEPAGGKEGGKQDRGSWKNHEAEREVQQQVNVLTYGRTDLFVRTTYVLVRLKRNRPSSKIYSVVGRKLGDLPTTSLFRIRNYERMYLFVCTADRIGNPDVAKESRQKRYTNPVKLERILTGERSCFGRSNLAGQKRNLTSPSTQTTGPNPTKMP